MSENPPIEPPRGDGATIVPTMRYRDARAAIRWLCDAFGFRERFVVPGEGDEIAHCQLTFGRGMVMVGSARDDEYGRLVAPPEPGRPLNQAPYVIVADAAAHHARAVAAGARIVRDLVEEPYGGKAFACLDPEGFLWNFGEYDPFAESEG